MKKYKTPIRAVALACALTTAFQIQAQAEQLYYFGFENSLVNEGSLGGTATKTGSPIATDSKGTPTGLGSSYAEYCSSNSNGLTLPSTAIPRLDTAASSMTVSLWMYIDAATYAWTNFLSTRNGAGNSGWYLTINPSGNPRLGIDSTASPNGREIASTNTVSLQQWVNVVIEMKGSSGVQGDWKVYINGVDSLNTTSAPAGLNNQQIVMQGGSPIYYDDLAIWDTFLGAGKSRALTTAPTTLATENAYNAGVMDDLFSLYDAGAGSLTVNSLTWNYASGFDTTGHVLGDTWTTGDTNYIWLGGAASSATGVATVPEPATWAMLAAGGLLVFFQRLRRRTQQLS